MESLPCQGCRGLCCGPVSITEREWKIIKKKVKSMPRLKRQELESQTRFYGTCIFYDMENDKCGIYSARPDVCQKFGYYKGLACFRKPELATKNLPVNNERYIGTLSVDFTWKDLH
ncbi:YkgJ family cysteine cluster protein [Bacillus sp. FJAT-29814]|uniref:YkgJ family cysteine cluster protein n=1 Tax=Bacillus sp. FJAT-29814 TaxID=1729688 RepID=UPI000834CCC7|nr:YkgJ family cysteine cluster protein [Bacillus sp. FJAT-29814]